MKETMLVTPPTPAGAPLVHPGTPTGDARMLRGFPAKTVEIVAAEGTKVVATDGRTYLDFGGASHGVALLGHNPPAVQQAIQRQMHRVMHVAQGVPNPQRGEFLDALHAALPPALTRTFIANSGAEAMECALKLAVAATGRSRFLAATDSFHGRTTGALSVTHRPGFRTPFQAMLPDATFVPFDDIEALRAGVTPDTAAIVLEPVQGEGGVRVASPAYLQAARDVATQHGALLIFDEIQSGLGRTGSFLASSPVVPDIVLLAKGLAGGLPIGTCSMTEAIAQKLPPGGHGSTYGGSPLVCAAGTAALKQLTDQHLPQRAADLGTRFIQGLRELRHPAIESVSGRGLMAGVRLKVRPAGVLKALQQEGILALAGGERGLRFLPPLTVEEADLERCVAALGKVLG